MAAIAVFLADFWDKNQNIEKYLKMIFCCKKELFFLGFLQIVNEILESDRKNQPKR